MLTRIILSQTRGQVMRSFVRRSHETHIPEKYMKFRTGHMDEALVPSGDWKSAYNQQQSRFNKQLALATIYFVATIAYLSQTLDFIRAPPLKNE